MKTILQKSLVFTALSLQQEKRIQIHHAFLAILIVLFAFLPATGWADIGSGSGSEVNFSCPASRNKCTCNGTADCERMRRTACAPGPLRCSGGRCSCTKKIVIAAQSGTTAPTPVVPRAGLATTPVVPRVGLIKGGKLWLTPSRPSYQNARLVTRPGVVGASMEVSCGGGKTYEISTGTGGGSCGVDINPQNGTVMGGLCSESGSARPPGEVGTNGASVSCSSGCLGSSGSGSCGETRP